MARMPQPGGLTGLSYRDTSEPRECHKLHPDGGLFEKELLQGNVKRRPCSRDRIDASRFHSWSASNYNLLRSKTAWCLATGMATSSLAPPIAPPSVRWWSAPHHTVGDPDENEWHYDHGGWPSASADKLHVVPRSLRLSMAYNQGSKMVKHAETTQKTGTARSTSLTRIALPWQRGTNENTNGLIGQYLPKSTDLCLQLGRTRHDADSKNAWPRKTLDWRTPLEVYA